MFLTVNQFAQCIKHEWKECSTFSPPATVILLLFLTFEALLFAVFTLIMLGTQMNAIWNDETVCTTCYLQCARMSHRKWLKDLRHLTTLSERRENISLKIRAINDVGPVCYAMFSIYKSWLVSGQMNFLLFSHWQGIEQLKKEEARWVRKSKWKSIQAVFGRFSIGWFSPFTKPFIKSKLDRNFYSV